MKKKNLALYAAFALAACATITSCGKNKNTQTTDPVVTTTDDTTPTTTKDEPVDTRITVHFDTMGGSAIDDVKGEAGSTLSAPAAPTKEYFTFVGWYSDKAYTTPYTFNKIPTEETTIYAKWSPVLAQYITFNSNGGSAVDAIYGNEGETIKLPQNPTKPGFSFAGWYTDSTLEAEFTATKFANEAITLYAKWTPVDGEYSITYHIGDDTKEVFIEDGKLAFGDDYIPAGTILDGWYLDSEYKTLATEGTTLTASIDLYASIYTKGLEFSADNTTVTGYTGTAKVVYLPTVYNNTTVTAIADSAFYGNKTITEIYIPESIVEIGAKAFYNAEYLKEAKLSSETEAIGEYAFYNCKRLETIESLGKADVLNPYVFAGCKLLEPFDTSKVWKYDAYCMAGMEKVTSLTLKAGVGYLYEGALADMTALEELHLPNTLAGIASSALSNTPNLKTITIAEDNAYYEINELGLCKKGKSLVRYLGDAKELGEKELEFYTILPYAFDGNTTIEKLYLAGVWYDEASLAGMVNLKYLSINLKSNPLAYYFGCVDPKANGSKNAALPQNLETVDLYVMPTEIPDYAFYGANSLTTVTSIDKITEVGKEAFAYTNLSTFAVSKKLTTISYDAFYGNKNLIEFTVDEENEVFAASKGGLYNKSLTELIMAPAGASELEYADTLTTIKSYAFYGASTRTIVIPDTVTTVEKNALLGAIGLIELETPFIGDGNENQYMQYLFGTQKTVNVEVNEETSEETRSVKFDSVNDVPRTLRHITITKPVSVIPEYAFAYFEGLDTLDITGVEKISEYAFVRTGFTEITIPKEVKEVEKFAFAYCYSLTKADIYAETLGLGIFAYSFRVQELTFEDGVKAIPDLICYPYRDQDAFYGEDTIYSSLKTITIYPSVESIGTSAFYYAGVYDDNIYDLTVDFVNASESKLTTIGEFAFANAALKKIELPASVTTVASRAFAFSDTLETVVFGTKEEGSKLETIGSICFAFDSKLDSITIHKNVTKEEDLPYLEPFIPEGSSSAIFPFYQVSNLFKLYVPEASLNIYKSSDNYYASGIISKINAIK